MNVNQYTKLKNKTLQTSKLFPKDYKVVKQLQECSCNLFVEVYKNKKNQYKKSIQSFTCKNKFCSLCEKKKSIKIQHNLRFRMEDIAKRQYQRFTFLTLTIKSIPLLELRKTVKHMNLSWNRLKTNLEKNHYVTGTIKKLEVTYTRENGVIMCHPHFHISQSHHINTFRHKKLLSQAQYVDKWKKSLGVDYTPICDVRTFNYKQLDKSIKEITKYITKSDELKIFKSNELVILDLQLKGLRFYSSSKLLKIKTRDLDIDNMEEIDLNEYMKVCQIFMKYNPFVKDYIISRMTNENNQVMNSDEIKKILKFIEET